MSAIPVRTIQKSLLEKGFQESQGSKHTLYHLYHNGKLQTIFTRLSRGSGYKEYPINLIGDMKRQLKLDNNTQTINLLKCPMTHEQYLRHLSDKGLLSA